MKNIVIIDVDTDRERKLLLNKPSTINPPANASEAKDMVLSDITCVCEALCALIDIASQSKYADKKDLITTTITHLNKMLEE